MEVLIIGAGVSGLTCGVVLAEAGHRVRIWARDRTPRTTSDVAAAVWYPLRGERDERVERWVPVSFERFCVLPPEAGVIRRGGMELFRSRVDDVWWRDVLPGFRHARRDELPPDFVDGFVSEGLPVIEMPIYLPWLEARFASLGGMIEQRALSSLDHALTAAEVVVNCSGLGARELCGDVALHPVRGQVVRVRRFGLERFIFDEENPAGVVYILPRSRDVVLGGTRHAGSDSLRIDEKLERNIIERCAVLEPRVLDAEIVSRAVGLRPGRPSVRLELEQRADGLIIHDYGHGGSGVTLSWGCAEEVRALLGRT